MTDDSDWCNPHDYDLKLDLSETNFHGMLGAILCWYQDNDNMPFEVSDDDLDESDSERRSEAELKEDQREVDAEARKEQKYIGALVGKITDVANLKFDKLTERDIWCFYDALGSVGGLDFPPLVRIYHALSEEWVKRRRRPKPK